MDIAGLIKPLGIVTYGLVLVALLSGLFRAKLGLKLSHHKRLALLAMILATIHGALVLIVY
ncbi:MAG: hypothetical protein JW742_01775 [Candidatus Aminicenantes bacterium]|nr:hypothetical protein [Candidatus Aminicenantes bacterium]